VKKYCPILAQAAASVGATQIRNRGTLGGNVCNASPAADTVPALVALGAIATVLSAEQERKVPLEELYVGVGKTSIGSNELLTFISIPLPAENSAGSFFKLGKRKAQAISIINGAVCIGVNAAERKFTDVHVVLGSVAPTVLRIKEAEERLIGRSINRQNIENAAEIVKNNINPITDVRATAEYRKDVSGDLFIEAMSESLEQLGVDISI
jgi:CO/xanthine dehydrogenase FAD-binding subunit